MNDSDENIKYKVTKARTDSLNEIFYDLERKEINNLMSVYCYLKDINLKKGFEEFEG